MCRGNYDVIHHPFPINSQFWKLKCPQEKLKTMLMQNFGLTNKEHYGMLWYSLEWSIGIQAYAYHIHCRITGSITPATERIFYINQAKEGIDCCPVLAQLAYSIYIFSNYLLSIYAMILSKYLITWNFRDKLILRISRYKKNREIKVTRTISAANITWHEN